MEQKTFSILISDDDDGDRKQLKRGLKKTDFDCQVCLKYIINQGGSKKSIFEQRFVISWKVAKKPLKTELVVYVWFREVVFLIV